MVDIDRERARKRENRRRWVKANPERARDILRRFKEHNPNKANEYQRKYRELNRSKLNSNQSDFRKRNPSKVREYWLKHKYGITLSEYNSLLEKQNYVCAICKQKRGAVLAVDHCHDTGKVRGLLCRLCNTSLGIFKTIDLLESAKTYLTCS